MRTWKENNMNIDFGLSTWKPAVFQDTLNLYAGDLCDYAGITALTTPFSFSSVTTSSSNGLGGSTFSNFNSSGLRSTFSNSFSNGFGYSYYNNNNSKYGYGNSYDVAMDVYYNMQEHGIKYPSLMGQRTRLAGDYINEINMWNDMNIKDVLCGQFNKFTAIGVEQIFTNLLSC